jgi:tetratricopeptide (TPR) repeat protein
MCPLLKILSKKLQPFTEVNRVILEILKSNKANNARVLDHLISYAEFQFGSQITGIGYRERDGQRIGNWEVTNILKTIYCTMSDIYTTDESCSDIKSGNMAFPYLKKSFDLLRPWMILIDSNASTDTLSTIQIDSLLDSSVKIEHEMAFVCMNRNQFDTAEEHLKRCLTYSRRYGIEGEEKITVIFECLRTFIKLRLKQGDLLDAVKLAEEAYDGVAIAYNPVHLQVQEAAGLLITILIQGGDLAKAEGYALQTYENLRDKRNGIDQEGEAVARGSYNLADLIRRQNGDLIKAENLAREALRIRTRMHGSTYNSIGASCDLLANILMQQGKFGDETKTLFERSLALHIRHEGPDGTNTALGNISLGKFHYSAAMQPKVTAKRAQLLLAKSYSEEGIRIQSKIAIPTHPNAVAAASLHAIILEELSYV